MCHHRLKITFILLLFCAPLCASAEDVIEARLMSLELAADIAKGAVDACRKLGYQVAAVVVDRSGIEQVVMRDVHASRFNTEIARDKANAAVLGSVSTGEFIRNRPEIIDAMNHVSDVLVLRGALPIQAAGSLLGAVGVSGALGGDKDESCAREALEAVAERLAFAE